MTSTTTSTPEKPGLARRFFAFPLVWLLIGGPVIFLFFGLLNGLAHDLITPVRVIVTFAGIAAAIGLYVLTMRKLARRRTPELRWVGGREFLLGGAVGAGFILASVMIVAALGGYTVTWEPVDVFNTVVLGIVVSLGAAVAEELVFRGLALQAMEAFFGPWVAIAITALLFGGMHIMNPGATLWSSIAIAIEAGVLLGAAFVWRRNLWFAIGLHFAWNAIQGLFGIPVSGERSPGLFVTTVHGDAWLTGGDFGVEASVISVGLSIVISTLMIVAAVRARARRAAERDLTVRD
ncbi:CPBP family intramembrane glutamic endopeptidase [Microbacterium paludicola]|uniref:CPBP family intramembrane glutamic endopeptidase n=1 Tax=Microbacterium paludicola TaxID=300019 RepID=UPI0011A44AC1|nr:type II CAAX endopeptidase family protein [Microbacterium paludicola]